MTEKEFYSELRSGKKLTSDNLMYPDKEYCEFNLKYKDAYRFVYGEGSSFALVRGTFENFKNWREVNEQAWY